MNRKFLAALVMIIFIACAGSLSYSYGGINEVQQSLGDGSVQNSTQQAAAAAPGQGAGAGTGVVMTDVLNVRNGPWGTIIGTVKQGAKLDITGKDGVWYKINYNGGTGFVHSGYIATSDVPATASDAFVNTPGTYLNVRSGAWGQIIGQLNHGSSVEILGKSGDWYQIKYKGKEAYVHANYITKTKPAGATPSTPAAGSTPASGGSGFGGRPVAGGPVTSEFGPRNLYGNYHYGIDIGVPTGTPLKSLGAGRVVSTGWDYGGGRTIVIKYDNGYTSTYCHCKDATVNAGDRVGQGQQVGHTNNTGAYTTGPHLHFAITNPGGTKINPRHAPGVVI